MLDEYVGERDLHGRSVVVKVVSVVAGGLILAALVWWTVRGGGDAEGPEPEAVKTLAVPVEEAAERRFDSAPAIGRSAPPLWRTIGERPSDLDPPTYGESWSEAGRVLVDVSEAVAAARTWRVGDRVGVEIPQLGERYEGPIDRIDVGPGYASAARGLATDADGRRRRFVVTVGPGRVFAYVDTHAGPYELVGNDRLAWLLPSSSMMAGFDFSEPDYILPGARIGTLDREQSAR